MNLNSIFLRILRNTVVMTLLISLLSQTVFSAEFVVSSPVDNMGDPNTLSGAITQAAINNEPDQIRFSTDLTINDASYFINDMADHAIDIDCEDN